LTVTINASCGLVGGTIDDAQQQSSSSLLVNKKLDEGLLDNVAGLLDRLSLDGSEDNMEEVEVKDYFFVFKEGNHHVSKWSGSVLQDTLYIEFADGTLPAGSRDCFVTLLDYAEEKLEVTTVVLCFPKSQIEEAKVLRAFMYLGFEVIHNSTCNLVPQSDTFIFMAYGFE